MIIRFSSLVLQQQRESVCIFFVLSLGGVYVCCAGFALVVALTMGSVVHLAVQTVETALLNATHLYTHTAISSSRGGEGDG